MTKWQYHDDNNDQEQEKHRN